MKDRVAQNPGRMLIAPENGSAPFYATVTLADNPVEAGTPLNKSTLLTDELCTAMGLATTATPTQAMDKLRTLVSTATATANTKGYVAYGSYVGTGTSGAKNPTTLSFSFKPRFVIINGETEGYLGLFVFGTAGITFELPLAGSSVSRDIYGTSAPATWGEKSLSWYSMSATTANASYQLNKLNVTYHYIAIG